MTIFVSADTAMKKERSMIRNAVKEKKMFHPAFFIKKTRAKTDANTE